MKSTDELVIFKNVGKSLLHLLGCAAFVAGGCFMWSLGELIIKIMGLIGIAFFGLMGILILVNLIGGKPALILNQYGIVNNTTAAGSILIDWADIKAFKIKSVKDNELILVLLKNPEKYLRKVWIFNRFWMKINYKWYGTPLCIVPNTLTINAASLLKLITEYQEQHGHNES